MGLPWNEGMGSRDSWKVLSNFWGKVVVDGLKIFKNLKTPK